MSDTTDIKSQEKGLRAACEAAADCGYVHNISLDGRTIEWLLDQLETERQRVAGSEEELHKALHREKAAERKLLAAQEEIAELKAKLANPVVLEYRKHDGFTDPEKVRLINAVTDRCAAAIKESGFTVKEGQ